MRKPSVVKGYSNLQKIRVIVDGVGLYMRVGEIDDRFLMTKHRVAVMQTLELMKKEGCEGIGHTLKVYGGEPSLRVEVQVDLM